LTDVATTWLTATQAHAWLGLVRTTQLLFDELDRQLRADAAMTHADYQLLALLSQAPAHHLNITALARAMCFSQSRVSHAVARLGERGWIERRDDPRDGRGSVAVLTDAGFGVLQAAAPGHVAAVRRHLFDQLSAEQVRQLGAVCDAALAHLNPGSDALVPPPAPRRKAVNAPPLRRATPTRVTRRAR
jgi:DNA-binding MarR family transcriptional regulator